MRGAASDVAFATDLLEREELLAALDAAADRARAGTGTVVVVTGEAGAGKSSLVRAASERSGLASIWGYCDPLTTPTPLGPLRDMAHRVGGSLSGVFDRGVAESRTAVMSWLGTGAPRILVIEDAHWIDDGTADVLKFIGRRLTDSPTVLVMTARDEMSAEHPFRRLLGELATTAPPVRLEVPALSASAVEELAAASGHRGELMYELTRGNAFLVTELLSGQGDPVPTSVSESVAARVASLSPAARRVVTLLAVMPRRCHLSVVMDYGDYLDEAIVAGLLVSDDDWLSFRHELVRLAIEAALPPIRRSALHAEVMTMLTEHGINDPAALAHHADGARDVSASVVQHQAAAAGAVAAGAHRAACSHYERALRGEALLSRDDVVDLLHRLSTEQFVVAGCAAAVDAASRSVDLLAEGDDKLRLGNAMRWLSRVTVNEREADRLGLQAVALLEPFGATPELAAAYAQRAAHQMLSRHLASSVAWASKALDVARFVDDEASAITALQARGSALLLTGDAAGANDMVASIQRASAAGMELEEARAHANFVSGAGEACLYGLSETAASDALPFFLNRDLDGMAGYVRVWRARCLFEQGTWAEATRWISAAMDGALQPHPETVLLGSTLRGRMRARRGERDVWSPLDKAKRLADPSETLQGLAPVAAARAEARWLAGEKDDGEDGLIEAYELACSRDHAWTTGELAFWMWRHGLITELPSVAPAPYQLHVAGDYAAAAAAWDVLGRPYDAAEVRADSCDDKAWRQALHVFDRFGARPARARLARRMRLNGVRNIPRGPRTSTQSGPHGLTVREHEVLGLVRLGHTDAEIAGRLHVSTKTVGHHVSAVLRKTGTSSRRHLHALAR